MSLSKRKIKNSALAILSVSLCVTLTSGLVLSNFNGKSVGANTNESLSFTDVTRDYDTTGLMKQNFNSSSVISAPKATYETRTVIVSLEGKSLLEAKSTSETVSEYAESSVGFKQLRELDEVQKNFLNRLKSKKISYTLKSSYTAIANAVAIEVDTSYVSQIKNMPGVESVEIARTYLTPQTVEAPLDGNGAVKNDSYVYKTGIYDSSDYSSKPWGTGAGTVVAVIDTGLDYTHDAFSHMPATQRFKKNYITEKVQSTTAYKRVAALGGSLTADNVYVNEKVPFAFDYADTDADVYPSYSNHGTHVAGIIGGQADSYTDKDGNKATYENGDPIPFVGVAPDCQLVICKTFTDNLDDPALGGAEAENIMAALEDCVVLGVDVINMSLGTTAGFTSSDDGDEEGTTYNRIFNNIQQAGISLICAASNDYSAGFGSNYGTNLASNPDSATVGSPSSYYAALSVASVSGQKSEYMRDTAGNAVFFENASDGNSVSYDFVKQMLGDDSEKEFEYVVAGTGQSADYTGLVRNRVNGKIALVQRGGNTFQQKVELASLNGAIGIIVYNNVPGTIRMSLGDVADDDFVPAVSITMDAGTQLKKLAGNTNGSIGKITISKNLSAGPFMSPFSSWGPTPDLKIKPEITAHGGEITSTVPGGYAEQSGTSMASPNMAGLTALVRNYVKTLGIATNYTPSQITQLTNQLIMSTATTAFDEGGDAYSPRKQGAGLANLDNIIGTRAYISTQEGDTYYYNEKDGRPKVEFQDDKKKTGVYTFNFHVNNFDSDNALNFTPKALFMTETLASDGIAVAEKAYALDDIAPVFTVGGATVTEISVPAGGSVNLTVTLKLSAAEKEYIDKSFSNGMYVEGFIKLVSGNDAQCDLTLPFLGFYGDWEQAPMLDMDAYELAKLQQNSALNDDEKPSATVWATQPYASYWNEDYVIPLGSFVYTQDPDPSKQEIYANMEYNAVSRYNEYYNEDGIGNYLTTYNIRCVYAGLLRNARYVKYYLYDEATGELVYEGQKNRISKAYANGGSARPAYLELKLSPDDLGLLANGKYRFDFEFLFNENSKPSEENTYSFDFYVDYEAPVLRDARLRYYNYKQGTKDKQRIYLDLDVFDNHYAQSVMLCYRDDSDGEVKLKLATEYVTPVTNPNRNGVTTVSIEVTDIWEEYKDRLTVQLDDYALNHATYQLNAVNNSLILDATTAVNKNVLPDKFTVPESEKNITVNIYEAHKLVLDYEGTADISNFIMSLGGAGSVTQNQFLAVKNGEIVGLKSTNGMAWPVTISNGRGYNERIYVTVTDKVNTLSNPEFSFNIITSNHESLVKAKHSGSITVNAGEDIQLKVMPDPWYYPMDGVQITWDVRQAKKAIEVDSNGKVHTIAKGSAAVIATIMAGGARYTVNFTFNVADPFTIENMALTHYHGDGETVNDEEHVVVIPEGKNIMSIGEEAFKNNKVIEKVIIPKTVTSIGKKAFYGCTNLKGVYFINDDKDDYTTAGYIADADLTLIDRNAFEGCTKLEVLDLSDVKVITVAREAFKDCESLNEVVKSKAIGTAHDRAFLGCKALTSIDITGLHTAGLNVFSGCKNLSTVETARYTAIGTGMFSNLHYEYQVYSYDTNDSGWKDKYFDYPACIGLKTIDINASTVGDGAFENCTGLTTVKFGNGLELFIGANAFKKCSSLNSVNFANCTVKSVGAQAFTGTSLTLSGQSVYTVSGNALLSKDGKTLFYYLGTGACTIPGTVTTIGDYAFANSSVSSITIPSSVAEIGVGAFANSELSSITFDSGSNLTTISAYAFYNTKLSTVAVPSTVTSIGDFAFAGHSETGSPLTTFSFSPSNQATLGSFVFSYCTSLTEMTLHANINVIGDRTFMGCTALKEVTLPSLVNTEGVTALGEYTFWNTPALETVTFGENSNTTGNFTFAADSANGREHLTSVTLGNALGTVVGGYIPQIGDYAFYNCVALETINLCGATKVGTAAFMGCSNLATVTGLKNLTEIGDYAFADCSALTSLEINSAKTLGDFAFAGIGANTVTIPANLTKIGYGAFAASSKLTSFNVASGNNTFFVIDGVLFEHVMNVDDSEPVNNGKHSYVDTGKYTLVAFPSAKTVAETEGEKVYTLPDETVKVAGSAFRGLTGGIDKVVLPYGLKVIGAAAFYDSGITKYEFKGATAPLLETDYSAVIDKIMDGATSFKGYYYANFEGDFIFYANIVEGNTVPLTIYHPDNGNGYDNYVFTNYFGTSVLTGVTMSEATNSFIELVNGFASASEIAGWKEPDMPKSKVERFSESVKTAHVYYNTFSDDEYQLSFVDSSLITKFNDIETALRQIKKDYNIPVTISNLSYTGNFKSEYKVGETFNISGLQVIIIYDDYSTEYADMSKVTYNLHDPLTLMDNVVELQYEGKTLFVRINVTEGNPNDDGGCNGGCGSISSIGGPMIFTFTAIGLMCVFTTISRRKNRGNR
ncbi:MAG: leucine-rich repeat protein [Clostridia bacterium]|nr:leucine-rich repeat protein [Clostridia bacterium]